MSVTLTPTNGRVIGVVRGRIVDYTPAEIEQREKQIRLREALADIAKRFGGDAIRPASQIEPPAFISTGFPELDQALGAGLPRGRIVDIYGPESAGKTTLCLHIIAKAQKAVQTQNLASQQTQNLASPQAAFIDTAHKLDLAWAAARGVDVDRLLVSHPASGEEALEVADGLVRSGAVSVVVIDDTAGLANRAELEGEMGDNHKGMQEHLVDQALRKLVHVAWKNRVLLVFVSQLRDRPNVLFGSPEEPTGGRALRYYATIGIDLRRQQAIKKGGQVIGNRVRAVVKKNQVATPYAVAEFDILFGGGER